MKFILCFEFLLIFVGKAYFETTCDQICDKKAGRFCGDGCFRRPSVEHYNCAPDCANVPFHTVENNDIGICQPQVCEERVFNQTAFDNDERKGKYCDYCFESDKPCTNECFFLLDKDNTAGKCLSVCPKFYEHEDNNEDTGRECKPIPCDQVSVTNSTNSLPCGPNCYLRFNDTSYSCVSGNECENENSIILLPGSANSESGICDVNCGEHKDAMNCLFVEEDSAYVSSCPNTYEYTIVSCLNSEGCKNKCVKATNCGQRFPNDENIYPCGIGCFLQNNHCVDSCSEEEEEEFITSYSFDENGNYLFNSVATKKCIPRCIETPNFNLADQCGVKCYLYSPTSSACDSDDCICLSNCPANTIPGENHTCIPLPCARRKPIPTDATGAVVKCTLLHDNRPPNCVSVQGKCYDKPARYTADGDNTFIMPACTGVDVNDACKCFDTVSYVINDDVNAVCTLIDCASRTPHISPADGIGGGGKSTCMPDGLGSYPILNPDCFLHGTTCLPRCPNYTKAEGESKECVEATAEEKNVSELDSLGCWTDSVQYKELCIAGDSCPPHTLPVVKTTPPICELTNCAARTAIETPSTNPPSYCSSSNATYADLCLPCGPTCSLFVPSSDEGQRPRGCVSSCSTYSDPFLSADPSTGRCVNSSCTTRIPIATAITTDDTTRYYPCGRWGEEGGVGDDAPDRCFQDMQILRGGDEDFNKHTWRSLGKCVRRGQSAENTTAHGDYIVYNARTGRVEKKPCVDVMAGALGGACGPLCVSDVGTNNCAENCGAFAFAVQDAVEAERQKCSSFANCTEIQPVFTYALSNLSVCGPGCLLQGESCVSSCGKGLTPDGFVCTISTETLAVIDANTKGGNNNDSFGGASSSVLISLIIVGVVLLVALVGVVVVVIIFFVMRQRSRTQQMVYEQNLFVENEIQLQERKKRRREARRRREAGEEDEVKASLHGEEEEYSYLDVGSSHREGEGKRNNRGSRSAADIEKERRMEQEEAEVDEREEEDDETNIIAAPTPKPGERPLVFGDRDEDELRESLLSRNNRQSPSQASRMDVKADTARISNMAEALMNTGRTGAITPTRVPLLPSRNPPSTTSNTGGGGGGGGGGSSSSSSSSSSVQGLDAYGRPMNSVYDFDGETVNDSDSIKSMAGDDFK